jgi:hypothetical protein
MDVLVDTPRRRPRRPISRQRRFGGSRAAGTGREGGGRVEDDGEFARTDLEYGGHWHLEGQVDPGMRGEAERGGVRVCIMYEAGIDMVCYRMVEEKEVSRVSSTRTV